MKTYLTALIGLAFLLAGGCASPEVHAQKQRAELLAKFPPGTTTRAAVMAQWNYLEPETVERRPAAGWEKCPNAAIGKRCVASEKRTGKKVNRCERYSTADGMFSVSYNWFFYDAADRVVDVEWERASD